MTHGKLFQYAVLFHPKTRKDAAGNPTEEKKSELLTELTTVLAGSTEEVGILAARSLPETYLDRLSEVEIVIRPF